MQTFSKFFLALAFLGGSAAAQAAGNDDEVSRMPPNKSGERLERVGKSGWQYARTAWNQGLSQQGEGYPQAGRLYSSVAYDSLSATYNGVPVAQKTVAGDYDVQQARPVLFSTGSAPDWRPVQQSL